MVRGVAAGPFDFFAVNASLRCVDTALMSPTVPALSLDALNLHLAGVKTRNCKILGIQGQKRKRCEIGLNRPATKERGVVVVEFATQALRSG